MGRVQNPRLGEYKEESPKGLLFQTKSKILRNRELEEVAVFV